jgi:hypothetical protein
MPLIGAIAPTSLAHQRDHAAAVKERLYDKGDHTAAPLLDQTPGVALPTHAR